MIRLFIDADLATGVAAAISREQAHYLANVMRLVLGAEVLVFNGRDGEWLARRGPVGKRGGVLEVVDQRLRQAVGPDLDLLVAVVKRVRLETIVEKAAELGVRRVRLLLTTRTNADRVNLARLQAIATEASEQTGRLDVPQILAPEKLASVLTTWPEGRRLMFCDEELSDAMMATDDPAKLSSVTNNSAAVATSACPLASNWKQLRPLAHSLMRTDTPSRSK